MQDLRIKCLSGRHVVRPLLRGNKCLLVRGLLVTKLASPCFNSTFSLRACFYKIKTHCSSWLQESSWVADDHLRTRLILILRSNVNIKRRRPKTVKRTETISCLVQKLLAVTTQTPTNAGWKQPVRCICLDLITFMWCH